MKREDLIKVCRYYHGEETCPYDNGTPRYKFWHGELTAVQNELDLSSWIDNAKAILKNLPKEKAQTAQAYTIEQFALLIYIEQLYSRFNPYDNLEWIEKY